MTFYSQLLFLSIFYLCLFAVVGSLFYFYRRCVVFLSYFSFEVSHSVLDLARCFAFSVRFLSIKVIDLHHMADGAIIPPPSKWHWVSTQYKFLSILLGFLSQKVLKPWNLTALFCCVCDLCFALMYETKNKISHKEMIINFGVYDFCRLL